MQLIKRILVALDLTDIDKTIIQYAAFLTHLYDAEHILFVHIEKDYDKLYKHYPELKDSNLPPDESLLQEVQKKVDAYFTAAPEVKISCEIKEGTPIKEIAHLSEERKIDLIVVGHKKSKYGSGLISKKLARIGRSNMCFVPEDSAAAIQRILVPLDFSEYSELALRHAIALAQKLENPEIIVQHIYQVPTGHYKIGKSYKEMAERMKKLVEGKVFSEVSAVPHGNIPIRIEYTLTEHDDSADQIVKATEEMDVSLLVMGAKGQSAVSAFLLGSHTEKVLKHLVTAPVLVVKKHDEKLSFLDTVYIE